MWQERYPGLWSFLQLASAVVLGSLVWLFCSLPLVTLPLATAGLYAVAAEATRGLEFNLLGVFWQAARSRWLRALALWWLDAAALCVLGYDLWFFITRPGWLQLLAGVALSLFVVLCLVNLYAWPLLVSTDWGLWRLLKVSALLAGVHLFRSLGVALVVVALLLVAYRWPFLAFAALPGAIALLSSYNAGRLLRRYLPEEEPPAAEYNGPPSRTRS